jgi:hypothetical protein
MKITYIMHEVQDFSVFHDNTVRLGVDMLRTCRKTCMSALFQPEVRLGPIKLV